jgi:sugar lactone lactonase YvrE
MDQLVERYLTQNGREELVVQAALPRLGVAMLGEELPDLPRNATEALRATRATDLRPLMPVLKVVAPTQWVLSGRQTLTLPVEGPAGAPPMPPSALPPGAQPQPPEGGQEEEQGETEEAGESGLPDLAAAARDGLSVPEELAGPRWAGAPPVRGGQGPSPPAPKEEAAKPLARAPEVWVQQTRSDLAQAKLNDVTVADDGRISLGPGHADLGRLPVEVIWSLAARDNAVYAGTGSKGLIYKLESDGKSSQFFATGEMNVHALAFDQEGNLYAGTSPRGKLFRIAPDGAGKLLYDSDSTYLWCLAMGPDGTIYAGAGSPARVYAIRPDGQAKVLAELPTANVLSLALSPGGDLYAGTAEAGLVYRVRPDGSATAVCRVGGTSVDALVIDDKSNVYASSSPTGEIYRIPASGGLPSIYCDVGEKLIYGLALIRRGAERPASLLAATGPGGLVIEAEQVAQAQQPAEGQSGQTASEQPSAKASLPAKPRLLFKPESGVATAITAAGDAVYTGSTAPAVVRRLAAPPLSGAGDGLGYVASGTIESPVFDAGRAAAWGYVHYTAETPTGTAVAVETRSGDTPRPEDHWSAWTPAPRGAVVSPPARHLQYRLVLTTTDPKVTPTVRQVQVTYLPQNRPPQVVVKAPSPGEKLAKKYTVRWQAQDPDKDALSYEVAVSSDLGATWRTLKQGITDTKYDWETTPTNTPQGAVDGRYLLRVTASDAQSQPANPQQAEAAMVVWVDNTPPTVMLLRSSLTVGEDKRVQVKGLATDNLSPIRSVEYRADTGDWRSLPLPAIDSMTTDYAIATNPLPAGKHNLEVRAFDAAGNMASDKVQATVKK